MASKMNSFTQSVIVSIPKFRNHGCVSNFWPVSHDIHANGRVVTFCQNKHTLFHSYGNTYCEWDVVLLLPRYKSPYLNASLLARRTVSAPCIAIINKLQVRCWDMIGPAILKPPRVHNRIWWRERFISISCIDEGTLWPEHFMLYVLQNICYI